MPIPEGHKGNFETLKQAVRQEAVSLMWCWDQKDGRFVAVVCAMNAPDAEDPDYHMVPLAMMLGEENPYERFLPPEHPNYPEDANVPQDIRADDGSDGSNADEPAEEAGLT